MRLLPLPKFLGYAPADIKDDSVSTHYSPTHARSQVLHHPVRRRASGPRRLLSCCARLLALAFVALGVRLFFIQVVDHATTRRLSVDAGARSNLTTTALRAGIYDRNGQILAVSRPTSLVIADDFQIKHPFREAQAMSPLVQVPVSQLDPMLSDREARLRHLERQVEPERRPQALLDGLPGHRRAELVGAHVSQRHRSRRR